MPKAQCRRPCAVGLVPIAGTCNFVDVPLFVFAMRLVDTTTKKRNHLARIFHELLSRDHADGRATW